MVINYEQIKAVNAELKTTDVKGKEYAEVPQRVTAFRKLHPMGSIRTDIVSLEDGVCVIRAEAWTKDDEGNDILLGVSVLRNRNLADVFYRLRLIEAYGIGMPKIQDCYADCEVKPAIEISDNAFKITLPNINSYKSSDKKNNLTEREKLVMSLFDSNEFVTRAMVQKLAGCSQTTAITTLKNMVNKNLLAKSGNGAGTKYLKA